MTSSSPSLSTILTATVVFSLRSRQLVTPRDQVIPLRHVRQRDVERAPLRTTSIITQSTINRQPGILARTGASTLRRSPMEGLMKSWTYDYHLPLFSRGISTRDSAGRCAMTLPFFGSLRSLMARCGSAHHRARDAADSIPPATCRPPVPSRDRPLTMSDPLLRSRLQLPLHLLEIDRAERVAEGHDLREALAQGPVEETVGAATFDADVLAGQLQDLVVLDFRAVVTRQTVNGRPKLLLRGHPICAPRSYRIKWIRHPPRFAGREGDSMARLGEEQVMVAKGSQRDVGPAGGAAVRGSRAVHSGVAWRMADSRHWAVRPRRSRSTRR